MNMMMMVRQAVTKRKVCKICSIPESLIQCSSESQRESDDSKSGSDDDSDPEEDGFESVQEDDGWFRHLRAASGPYHYVY